MVVDEKVNPWLAERLRKLGVDPLVNLLLEVDARALNDVINQLKKLGISVEIDRVSVFPRVAYIPIVADTALLDAIARLPGVIKIHYNAPVWIRPFFFEDKLLGKLTLSKVEVPGLPTHTVASLPFAPLIASMKIALKDVEIIPSEPVLRTIEAPQEYPAPDFKIAVIDTGATVFHPQLVGKTITAKSGVLEPAPIDFLGHGTWVTTAILGEPRTTRFGLVKGVADKANRVITIKALSAFGFGNAGGIIKAMEQAWRLGAKVINMSLGGPLQGSVDDDPMCRVVKQLAEAGVLCVVAAGNEGPDEWTIGSPGASPYALTVGAYSLTDEDVPFWSSRGPSGEFYKENPDIFEEDYEKYGDNLIKPDVIAPGGGRAKKTAKPDEVLYSGCTGMFDGYYDLLQDLYEGSKGTSMATPIATGLIAILLKAGKINSVEDVKARMREVAKEKDETAGYGLLKASYFA